MSYTVEGLFLKQDFTEIIPESFVKKYLIPIDSGWITPFGYLDQYNHSILCNSPIPDGTYGIVGKVEYPSQQGYHQHTVIQYNLCKVRGADVVLAKPFFGYPGLPPAIKMNPKFPMYRVSSHTDYHEIKRLFHIVDNEGLTIHNLTSKMFNSEYMSTEYKLYGLKISILQLAQRSYLYYGH